MRIAHDIAHGYQLPRPLGSRVVFRTVERIKIPFPESPSQRVHAVTHPSSNPHTRNSRVQSNENPCSVHKRHQFDSLSFMNDTRYRFETAYPRTKIVHNALQIFPFATNSMLIG